MSAPNQRLDFIRKRKKVEVTTEEGTKLIRRKPNELDAYEEWFRDKIDLSYIPTYARMILKEYEHDAESFPIAVAAIVMSTVRASLEENFSTLSPDQANTVSKEIIRRLANYKGPVRLIAYDNMLEPWNYSRFEKQIPINVWKWMQKEAKARLENLASDAPEMIKEHLQSIVDGKPPFGYTVQEDPQSNPLLPQMK